MSGVFFTPPPAAVVAEKPRTRKRAKVKNDPRHVAAARELRDRWLEQLNSGLVQIEAASAGGKYDVSRRLTEIRGGEPKQTVLLAA